MMIKQTIYPFTGLLENPAFQWDATGFTNVMPPRIDDVKTYFNQKGMPEKEAEVFFLFYDQKHWRNKKGNVLKGWKNSAWRWVQSVIRSSPGLFDKSIH